MGFNRRAPRVISSVVGRQVQRGGGVCACVRGRQEREMHSSLVRCGAFMLVLAATYADAWSQPAAAQAAPASPASLATTSATAAIDATAATTTAATAPALTASADSES